MGRGGQADNLCFTTNPNLELKFRSGPPCQESQSDHTRESCELILRPLALFSSQESPRTQVLSPRKHARQPHSSSDGPGTLLLSGTLYRRVGETLVKRARSLCPVAHFSHSKYDQKQPEDPQKSQKPMFQSFRHSRSGKRQSQGFRGASYPSHGLRG